MKATPLGAMYRKFAYGGAVLFLVVSLGTAGYRILGGYKYSLADCFYMTVITITTIGYAEVVDLSDKPYGRFFTIVVALGGIGTLTYMLSNFTAFIVEGDLNEAFRRRKMQKAINMLRNHYIVCGIDGVGYHIADEMRMTGRPHVIVDVDKGKLERSLERLEEHAYIEGDATDNSVLEAAGISQARGVFAVTSDDNKNLVISLTAKQLNPSVRVVSRCFDQRNIQKIRKAGADAVVMPSYIGGLRMASEMMRPQVVSFLDVMLRDTERNLRIEEVVVPARMGGKKVGDFDLNKPGKVLLLAVRNSGGWVYMPGPDLTVGEGDTLVLMTTPQIREELQRAFERGETG